MPTTREKWQEIANRGLQDRFDPQTRAKFDEAIRRGLITFPVQQSGDVVKQQPIQNDFIPTDANLAMQQPKKQEESLLNKIKGVGEAALTIGTGATSGALGFAAGSLSGIEGELTGRLKRGDGFGEAAKLASRFTFKPETQTGRDIISFVGDALSSLPPVLGTTPTTTLLPKSMLTRRSSGLVDESGNISIALEKALAERGISKSNLVDIAKSAPESGLIRESSIIKKAVNDIVVQQLKSKSRDNALADVRLSKGKVVNDKTAKNAINNGFDSATVQLAKTANPSTKNAMNTALDIAFKASKNSKILQKQRPSDVAGNALFDRIRFIKDKTNSAKKELNGIAKNDLKDAEFDLKPIRQEINNIFKNLDIEDLNNKGVPRPNFKGSQISGDRSSQRAIKEMLRILSESKRSDALGGHLMKRQLDNLIDFSKQPKQGLGKAGENALKSVRATINETLRKSSSSYARVNDVMSSSLTALDDLQKSIGKSIDLSANGADRALGTSLRGLFSNRQQRLKLDNAFSQIDNVAKELGGDFKVDYRDVFQFTNEIEDLFGVAAKTSLKGDVAAGAKSAIEKGFTRTVIDKAAEVAFRKKQNEFDAFNSMRELLKR